MTATTRLTRLAALASLCLLAGCGGSDSSAQRPAAPVKASELSGLSRSLHQPVYWAGPQGAQSYTLTRQGPDRILVHYPVKAGAKGELVVGTYRLKSAVAAVRRAAGGATARLHKLPRGGLALTSGDTDVHFAYPGQDFQVEVFDPAGRALELARSGRVRAVPTSPSR